MDADVLDDDYGMQITEIDVTPHVHGKCVGCNHSMDSYCKLHKAWAYNINDCGRMGRNGY